MAAIIDYRGKSPRKTSSGIPLVTAKIVKGGRVMTPEEFIAPEDYDDWMRRGLPEAGDVVMTTEAPLGEVAQLTVEKVALAQRLITLRGKSGLVDNGYLRYAMQSHFVQDQLRSRATGTTVIGIRQSELRKVKLPVPPLAEQRTIADILGTLDDKVELNRRTNQTLEAMGRALFESWFIDFDPVRAKASGRPPHGIDPATAALFPDRFQNSPLGPIPAGWKIEPLGDHVEAVKGLSYKGKFLSDTGMPLHNLNSVFEGGGYKHEGLKRYSGEYKERHLVRPGDVIVTNTEQGFEYLLIGYAAIVPKRYGDEGLFSHHLYRVRPRFSSPVTPTFLYLLFRSSRFHDLVTGYTNGTTVNMLPADGLQRPELVVPSRPVVQRFQEMIAPVLGKIELHYDENENLAEARDAMLPKLLRGDPHISEAIQAERVQEWQG